METSRLRLLPASKLALLLLAAALALAIVACSPGRAADAQRRGGQRHQVRPALDRRRLQIRPQRASRAVALLRHPRRRAPDEHAGLRAPDRGQAAPHHRLLWGRADPPAAARRRRAGQKRHGLGGRLHRCLAGDGLLQPVLHPRDPAGLLHLPRAGGRLALLAEPQNRLGFAGGSGRGPDARDQGDLCHHARRRGAGIGGELDLESLDGCRQPLLQHGAPSTSSIVGAGLAVWLIVALVLFSSFFTNASGPLDSIRTYLPWLAPGRGRFTAYQSLELLSASSAVLPCREGSGLERSADPGAGVRRRLRGVSRAKDWPMPMPASFASWPFTPSR